MSMRVRLLLPVVLAATTAACASDGSRPVVSLVTDEVLGLAPARQDGWHTYGRDWSNQRFVPLTEINRETVASLVPVWQHHLDLYFRRSTRNENTPLVVDDLLIYTDLKNLVIAVDVRNGRERWRYHPRLGPVALCCGMVNRGVAVFSDKVYLATLDARVIALHRRCSPAAGKHRTAHRCLRRTA